MSRLFSAIRRFASDRSGEAILSFAFALPLVLTVSFGILDISILLFEQGRATEATRSATRVAAISGAVANLDNIASGDIDCWTNSGTLTCNGGAVISQTSYDAIVADLQRMLPDATAQNVTVTYRNSNLGASVSGGIKPFVTVTLTNYKHTLTMMGAIPGLPDEVTFPDFSTTQLLNFYITP